MERITDPYAYMDETYAFISGYTPDGEPRGITWEQFGVDPNLPMEEKARLYYEINNESMGAFTLSDMFM